MNTCMKKLDQQLQANTINIKKITNHVLKSNYSIECYPTPFQLNPKVKLFNERHNRACAIARNYFIRIKDI